MVGCNEDDEEAGDDVGKVGVGRGVADRVDETADGGCFEDDLAEHVDKCDGYVGTWIDTKGGRIGMDDESKMVGVGMGDVGTNVVRIRGGAFEHNGGDPVGGGHFFARWRNRE